MKEEERKEYVKYRLESARHSLAAAKLLISKGFSSAAVNRLYYAAFYAVNALLVANNIETKSHKGSRTEFARHFIKSNKLNREYGKLFSHLHDLRQTGDYDYLPEFDKDTLNGLLIQTEDFLNTVTELTEDSFF